MIYFTLLTLLLSLICLCITITPTTLSAYLRSAWCLWGLRCLFVVDMLSTVRKPCNSLLWTPICPTMCYTRYTLPTHTPTHITAPYYKSSNSTQRLSLFLITSHHITHSRSFQPCVCVCVCGVFSPSTSTVFVVWRVSEPRLRLRQQPRDGLLLLLLLLRWR